VVVWLCGCVVVWLYGCLVVWLFGCVVVWLFGCVVAVDSRLGGYEIRGRASVELLWFRLVILPVAARRCGDNWCGAGMVLEWYHIWYRFV
jgi:hypothetical protein